MKKMDEIGSFTTFYCMLGHFQSFRWQHWQDNRKMEAITCERQNGCCFLKKGQYPSWIYLHSRQRLLKEKKNSLTEMWKGYQEQTLQEFQWLLTVQLRDVPHHAVLPWKHWRHSGGWWRLHGWGTLKCGHEEYLRNMTRCWVGMQGEKCVTHGQIGKISEGAICGGTERREY